jgi:hypothetical protein
LTVFALLGLIARRSRNFGTRWPIFLAMPATSGRNAHLTYAAPSRHRDATSRHRLCSPQSGTEIEMMRMMSVMMVLAPLALAACSSSPDATTSSTSGGSSQDSQALAIAQQAKATADQAQATANEAKQEADRMYQQNLKK